MSGNKRDEARKRSLDVLARIAAESGSAVPPSPPPEAAREPANPVRAPPPAERGASAPLEGKRAEEADRRAWKARRDMELARARALGGPSAAASAVPRDPEAAAREAAARARAEARRLRRESLQEFREKRQEELARGGRLERRGPWMDAPDVPRGEGRGRRALPPSLDAKITHVLGTGEGQGAKGKERRGRRRTS